MALRRRGEYYMRIGYKLATEGFAPKELIRLRRHQDRAESAVLKLLTVLAQPAPIH